MNQRSRHVYRPVHYYKGASRLTVRQLLHFLIITFLFLLFHTLILQNLAVGVEVFELFIEANGDTLTYLRVALILNVRLLPYCATHRV